MIASPADEDPTLIPGFAEGPPQFTSSPEERRRYWWGIGAAAAVGLALLTVIAVLAANRIGHHSAANGTPVNTALLTPTGAASPPGAASSSPSGAASSSTSRPGSTRPPNRQRGLAQASVIAGYLTQSGQARQGIGAAINAISGCTNIASAVTTLQHAADVRTGIVAALASGDVSALPNGPAAAADLRQAMRASANADRHYAAWGQAVAGCHGHAPQNADLGAAQQSDADATAAKHRFVDEWNPIAAAYGLPQQNVNTI